MRAPSVDIVIAAKNEATYIGSCLAALKSQDYPAERLCVYVADNGSTDDTAKIAATHGACVVRELKRGAAAARNHGIAQGSGELVGFLDAHCIPESTWVRAMTTRFRDATLGGLQGSMESTSTNRRVQAYLEKTGALSNKRILEDTVSGKRNIYPWILSGNCMYRREALEAVGCFDETLKAGEDVDLAWRVLLLGYQLGYAPEARLIHYDCNTWSQFLRKGLAYGGAAADLARRYRLHGATNKYRPRHIWSTSLERLLSGLYYGIGYYAQDARFRLGLDAPTPPHTPRPVLGTFRPRIQWTSGVALRIADTAIYWCRDDDQTSVIVHVPTKTRIVLDSVGHVIWQLIVDGRCREDVIRAIVERYNVASVTAAIDLDEFVAELEHTGVLIMERP